MFDRSLKNVRARIVLHVINRKCNSHVSHVIAISQMRNIWKILNVWKNIRSTYQFRSNRKK